MRILKIVPVFFLLFSAAQAIQVKLQLKKSVDAVKEFVVSIKQDAGEYAYYETLNVQSSSTAIIVPSWRVQGAVTELFDAQFHETKKVVQGDFTLVGTMQEKAPDTSAALVVSVLTNKMKAPEFTIFELAQYASPAEQTKKSSEQNQEHSLPNQSSVLGAQHVVPAASPVGPEFCPAPHQKKSALSDCVQRLLATSMNLWIKLLLALLLGILMSLTPCIYPMIPITVSILQGRGKRSLLYNFVLALSYTMGIALMFAFLGLSAALTGALFGSLMSKPIVIIAIVLMLAYFALSMFGLYEIRLPGWLSPSGDMRATGSIASAFAFGVLSGTVASPCLSPGLAFLLSIVATLGNKLLGFSILFMFGVGMSIPLLVIGTAASALRFMPKSGMWMVEVKKIFGILLFALCFYYMSNVLSLTLLLWLMFTCLLAVGMYALLSARSKPNLGMRVLRILFGSACVVGAAGLLFLALSKTFKPDEKSSLITWEQSYAHAYERAKQEHKLLFVDFGASYCSICNAIDRCILNDVYIASLFNAMVCVKIEADKSSEFDALGKKFAIVGVPVLLIIDAQTDTVLQRWGAEVYGTTKTEIGARLGELLGAKG